MTTELQNSLNTEPIKEGNGITIGKDGIRYWTPDKEELKKSRKENPNELDLLGLKSYKAIDQAIHKRKGFSFRVFKTFSKNVELTQAEVGMMIGLNVDKLKTRKKIGRLNWKESDKLWAVANVLEVSRHAKWKDIFTSEWLRTPNKKYFCGMSPLEVCSTETGRNKVRDVIFRIIFAINMREMEESNKNS